MAGGPRVAVVVMAKAPRPGEVKTRLVPPLDPPLAAELYRCFLLDRLEQIATLDGIRRVVAYAPHEAADVFAALAPGFERIPQTGDDLSARLVDCFARLFADDLDGVIVMDSDSPTLPLGLVRDAVRRMGEPMVDVVLGPTEDGGYYLLGLRAPHPELFTGMPWSTAGVCAETLARAHATGLTTASLATWYDVDTGADLARLRAELQRGGAPRHTHRFLTETLPG